MKADEFLKKIEVPDRTISGRKPKGQFPEYRSSLIELLESFASEKQAEIEQLEKGKEDLGNEILGMCNGKTEKFHIKGDWLLKRLNK